VLVPSACNLRELHGVLQAAMGWEGIHLYQFCLRAARYGSAELSASSPDVTLAALQFRKVARFVYKYDLNIPWRHEVRIEDRQQPGAGKAYPACISGSGACPPEDSGGPAAFMAARNRMLSLDTLEDLETMAEIVGQVALDRRPEVLDEDETRCDWSRPSGAARHVSVPKDGHSPGGRSITVCVLASIAASCISSTDAFGPALCQQLGGEREARSWR
jgi:Plasmid pRiA4b ORF-3-like protein